MKSIKFVLLSSCLFLITLDCSAKKPKTEKPQQNTSQMIDTQEYEDFSEPQGYQPNPVILNGVGQIMNGALSIAQNPHSRPNIGHSVAGMIHGIISIIIEKVAHKKMDPAHLKAMQDCCDEICADISKEITEIIIAKSLMFAENKAY